MEMASRNGSRSKRSGSTKPTISGPSNSSLPKVDQERLPPKLVEFNLATNTVIRQYDFKGVVSAKDSLNDLRIDLLHHYAYLTNAGNKGSLVVLDLKTGEARQVLVERPFDVRRSQTASDVRQRDRAAAGWFGGGDPG